MKLSILQWSLLANALLALAGAIGGIVWYSQADAADAKATAAATRVADLEAQLRVSKDNVALANTEHAITKASLLDVRGALAACSAARAVNDQQNRAASARVSAALADAEATLADITADFAAALRDPACTVCLNQPICPTLVK